jgi:hypothetical protein
VTDRAKRRAHELTGAKVAKAGRSALQTAPAARAEDPPAEGAGPQGPTPQRRAAHAAHAAGGGDDEGMSELEFEDGDDVSEDGDELLLLLAEASGDAGASKHKLSLGQSVERDRFAAATGVSHAPTAAVAAPAFFNDESTAGDDIYGDENDARAPTVPLTGAKVPMVAGCISILSLSA